MQVHDFLSLFCDFGTHEFSTVSWTMEGKRGVFLVCPDQLLSAHSGSQAWQLCPLKTYSSGLQTLTLDTKIFWCDQ